MMLITGFVVQDESGCRVVCSDPDEEEGNSLETLLDKKKVPYILIDGTADGTLFVFSRKQDAEKAIKIWSKFWNSNDYFTIESAPIELYKLTA